MKRLICIVITIILVSLILFSSVSDINYGYGPGYVPDYDSDYGDDYDSDYDDDYDSGYGDDYEKSDDYSS